MPVNERLNVLGPASVPGPTLESRYYLQVQRSATATSPSASSMCSPQPSQVGLAQLSQVTFLHMW